MITLNLDEIEAQAKTIRKHLEATEAFLAALAKDDTRIESDPYDTYPPALYEASVRPAAMKPLLEALMQLRPLRECSEAMAKANKSLVNDLRVANERHAAAVAWAMNNAETLKSHLAVCKHDEYVAPKKSGWKFMAGKKLL